MKQLSVLVYSGSQATCASNNFIYRMVFGLFALAVIQLIFATPAHADSISIDLDAAAVTLQRSGDLYEHTSSLHVHNSNTYGFTLSMNASQPNLVNSKDSTYKIDSVSGTNQKLAANQWGYGMGKNSTTFSSVSSAALADITGDNKGSCTSVDDCTLYLTFGANIDPKHLPTGSYSTSLTYTATSKPAPPAPDPEPSTPSSGGGSSSHSNLYYLCEGKYPGSSDMEKWNYCFDHGGDMSGYWDEKCRKEYSDDSDKESYCVSHDGDMSGYRVDWNTICFEKYHSYGEDDYKRSYCIAHDGDMSGYQSPDWNVVCKNKYPGSDAESEDKYDYCLHHYGTIDGYRPDWNAICNRKYYGYGSNARNLYCKANNGNMSEYNPEMEYICREKYPGYGNSNSLQVYCIAHGGNMGGYHP